MSKLINRMKRENEQKSFSKAVKETAQQNKVSLGIQASGGDNDMSVTSGSLEIDSLDKLLKAAKVDLDVWEVATWTANSWEVAAKYRDQDLTWNEEGLMSGHAIRKNKWIKSKLWQIKASLRRKTPEQTATESLLQDIKNGHKLKLPVYKRPKIKKVRRALEISIMDPHMGLQCFRPESDLTWSLDECEQAFMGTIERLLQAAESYGPFEQIVCPIGNDYLHSDTIWGTTTAGTPQPEAMPLHQTYRRARKLFLWYAERLRQVAPLEMIFIPGNHDRILSFTQANILDAYYQGAKAKDVTILCSADPYKFWSYGVNLIGFEHGHSVSSIRLAALMANETRITHWKDARFCAWHLGDQHRRGSNKTSTMEEQGVSIEYLPGLTVPNEWHRLKGFNWQKRGGVAFIYDHDKGQEASLQVNFDNYTGFFMGET